MNLHVTINNEPKEFICQPTDTLLDLLRREGYSGVKVGCSNGDCGICAVLLNGRTVNSCVILAAHCQDKKIETIEGIVLASIRLVFPTSTRPRCHDHKQSRYIASARQPR